MIHRIVLASLATILGSSLLIAEAQAGPRSRVRFFDGWNAYYPNPQYFRPRYYYRYFVEPEDLPPEAYARAYGDQFDEGYYEPDYRPRKRKPAAVKKKGGALDAPPAIVKKNTAPSKSTGVKQAAVAKPAAAGETPTRKPAASGFVSCDKASGIIAGYGFSSVEAKDCEGQVYAFRAARDGKPYAIKLNAANGELTEVRKVP